MVRNNKMIVLVMALVLASVGANNILQEAKDSWMPSNVTITLVDIPDKVKEGETKDKWSVEGVFENAQGDFFNNVYFYSNILFFVFYCNFVFTVRFPGYDWNNLMD